MENKEAQKGQRSMENTNNWNHTPIVSKFLSGPKCLLVDIPMFSANVQFPLVNGKGLASLQASTT